jgi:NAD(P)-dependent dehydrogenase (short-subunit alcohol dehydrogenase family)
MAWISVVGKRSAKHATVRCGRPPNELAGEVEERILDAAREVFLKHGFGGASIDEIAAVARSAKTTIYARFPNKRALFTAVVMREVAVRADSSDIADIAHLFEKVKAAKGRIDVLFANAGVYEFTPFGTITEGAYDKMFDINVKGVLFTVQQAVPLMADGGSIILTGSVAGSKGFEAGTVYSAT